MAKKDIARSALEGGRVSWSSYQKKLTHRERRAKERSLLRKVTKDPEESLSRPSIKNRYVQKVFTDKLNPAYRWLRSQVGRPWAKVYSELCQKYDIRSLNGYHILVQHLLPEVEDSGDNIRFRHFQRYLVNSAGILIHNPDYQPYRQFREKGLNREHVADKIGKRLIFVAGDKLFWARPKKSSGSGWSVCKGDEVPYTRRRTTWCSKVALHRLKHKGPGTYFGSGAVYLHAHPDDWKKGREFSPGEYKWWKQVTSMERVRYILNPPKE